MSEKQKNFIERKKPTKKITVKYIGERALILAGAAGATVALMGANQGEQADPVVINKAHKVYSANPGDTEWSIGSRAYPEMNELEAKQLVDAQNPNENHLVQPGQTFEFGTDAEIGKVVDPSKEHLGSGAEG